jgi:hypothetical protein
MTRNQRAGNTVVGRSNKRVALPRASERETGMSKDLSNSTNRDKLKKSSFALPEQEKYPIPDIEHARNALARVAQHGSEAEKKKVRAAVEKKYPSLTHDD